ncbi:MAG: hypothetical protein A2413_14560 [Treponema sp. RIFOXYC1_FULL_61_9]|nr:MAG: hypothetical protein A2413_14560 [Treponema sp. RIFOXYC1_FULL_61_9]
MDTGIRRSSAADRRADAIILGSLLLFCFIFRLSTLMMVHTGIDERDYWFAAKALTQSLPYPELTHRTVRFSVILPVALAQLVLGVHPNVYYLLPILNSMAQVALAFAVGVRIKGRLTGFLAALGLILFPYLVRAGSQVRPEIFSMTYMLFAVWFLIIYLERKEKPVAPLLLISAFLFLAYEAKITNLFFLPGFVAVILAGKRRVADALILCGSLFSLYLAETGLYAIFTEYRFGQLEVIASHHLSQDVPLLTDLRFTDLFRRYSDEFLQDYWRWPFAFFAVAGIAAFIRRKEKAVMALAGISASFFFFLTFAVRSFDPLVPAEDFINRYFCAVLGPVFLVLASAAEDILRIASRRLGLRIRLTGARYVVASMLLAVAIPVLFSFKAKLPASVAEYALSPLEPTEHTLVLTDRYMKEARSAYETGGAILAADSNGGRNALGSCAAYFLDSKKFEGGRLPSIVTVIVGGKSFAVLGRIEALEGTYTALAAVRDPLRLQRIELASIADLTQDAFPKR